MIDSSTVRNTLHVVRFVSVPARNRSRQGFEISGVVVGMQDDLSSVATLALQNGTRYRPFLHQNRILNLRIVVPCMS